MKFKSLTCVLLCVFSLLGAQNKVATQYANQLDSLKIKVTLTKLASEEFLGRKSTNEGIKLSADYLTAQMTQYKLPKGNKGSYRQSIESILKTKSTKYFNTSNFNYTDSYKYYNTPLQDSVITSNQVVYAGYGIYDPAYNDFANVDITNKIVLIHDNSYGAANKYGVKLYSSASVPSKTYIQSKKPKAVLMINDGFDNYSSYVSEGLLFESEKEKEEYPTVTINEALANQILDPTHKTVKQLKYEIEANGTCTPIEFEKELSFNGNVSYKKADNNNLVAIIEGSDLKNEYVVLSAHYDHIGVGYRDKVYNGADDNASGVAAVLEIARVFNQAKKEGKGPRRSVIVLFFTSEEDGLKGANYYLNNPIYPVKSTIACVNIDMIGRMGSDIEASAIKQGYVHAITGSSKANALMSAAIDSVNRVSTQLAIPLTSSSYYRRSDQYEFSKLDIPAVMFTNGEHADLHRYTDDVEKIDFPALTRRAQLAFLTVWEFANNPKPFAEKTSEVEVEYDVTD